MNGAYVPSKNIDWRPLFEGNETTPPPAARATHAADGLLPIAWRDVVKAIRAVQAEASRRGEMFPQTSDEQREDRAASRRVCEMIEWYATNGGAVAEKLTDWPKIAAASAQESQDDDCPACGHPKHEHGLDCECDERYAQESHRSPTLAPAAPAEGEGEADDDREMTKLIKQRDQREDVIDEILDRVLGNDRAEWSSIYGFADAVADVDERMTLLERAHPAPNPPSA